MTFRAPSFWGWGQRSAAVRGAVQVGAVQTVGKNSGQGLIPLRETGGDGLEALLHVERAQEAQGPRAACRRRAIR